MEHQHKRTDKEQEIKLTKGLITITSEHNSWYQCPKILILNCNFLVRHTEFKHGQLNCDHTDTMQQPVLTWHSPANEWTAWWISIVIEITPGVEKQQMNKMYAHKCNTYSSRWQ
jgi:hypothetical protein